MNSKSHSTPRRRQARADPHPAKISTFRQRDIWIEQLLAAKELSHGAKVVAARIALHFNVSTGQCYPSIVRLAQGTGIGERHIPRVLAVLERSGWLGITRSRGGRGYANSFHLITPKTLTRESGFRTKETLTPETRNTDSGVTPTAKNSERGRGAAPRPATRGGAGVGKELAADEFEDLRAAWPRPWVDDEAADRRAFEQARRHASVEDIIAGAAPWAAAMEARYLPSLVKWLGARGWEKPPPKRAKPKQRGNGKLDLTKVMLKQGLGLEEDDDGNLFDPETMGRAQ
jgi:hypothetical protein